MIKLLSPKVIDTTLPVPLHIQYERIKDLNEWEDYRLWVEEWASKGYAPAINKLGNHYKREEKFSQAFELYMKSAKQGFAPAQVNLSRCYENGWGVEKDNHKAVEWLTTAAEQGYAIAQHFLGFHYGQGICVERDNKKAFEWYTKAAEQGHARAQFYLGMFFYFGQGVDKDNKKAARWITKAAEQGDSDAQYFLGFLYEEGKIKNPSEEYTRCTDIDMSKLDTSSVQFQEIILDMNTNYTNGQYVSIILHNLTTNANTWNCNRIQTKTNGDEITDDCFVKNIRTDGTELPDKPGFYHYKFVSPMRIFSLDGNVIKDMVYFKFSEKNLSQAIIWYTKAAEQGHADAQFKLGKAYYFGNGVEKNLKQSVDWFTKAAEQGQADAQFYLGICYANGQGVAKDYKKAVEWYTKAAEQGDAASQCNLGVCYNNGQGVEKDIRKAVELYIQAANQGNAPAQSNLAYKYFYGDIVEQSDEKAKELFTKAGAIDKFNKLVAEREEKRRKEEEERLKAEEEKRLAEEERRKEEEERLKAEEEKRLAEEKRLKEEEEKRQEEERIMAAKKAEQERVAKAFEDFATDLLSKRGEAKSVGILWSKSHPFEILTTPLTVNIYNSFKSRTMTTSPDGDRQLDQYKDKNMVNELIGMMNEYYKEKDATFSIPSISEIVAAQTAKLVGKKGLYLVVHFPEFE